MLNRNQKRELERKSKRLEKWLNSLNREQRDLMTELVMDKSKKELMNYCDAFEIAMRVFLNDKNDNELIAEYNLDKLFGSISDELQKILDFRKIGGDYIMEIKNNKQGIIKAYEKMRDMGMKDKDIHEELYLKYPKLSNNAIKNVVLEYKRGLKAKEDETEIQKAAEYVLGEENSKKIVKNNKKPATINKEFDKLFDEVHLEELSKKVIADVKGSLGKYHVEDYRVTINDFTFATEKDIDQEIALRRKVIQDQLKELDVMNKEYRAVLKKYIA